MTITIAEVSGRQKGDALRLLFPDYANLHGDSSHLFSTPEKCRLIGAFNANEEIVAAVLLNGNQGCVAALVGPTCKDGYDFACQDLIDEAESYACQIGIRVIQAMLPTMPNHRASLLISAGYRVVAKIEGRAKSALQQLDVESQGIVDGISFHEVTEDEKQRFEAVFHSTSEDSDDLPFFQQTTSTSETLASMQPLDGAQPTRFVLTKDDRDIGCAMLNREIDQVELCYFGVVPESRGLGLGKVILEHCERWAKEKKATIITAYVDSENYVAKRVYDDVGFLVFAYQVLVAKELA